MPAEQHQGLLSRCRDGIARDRDPRQGPELKLLGEYTGIPTTTRPARDISERGCLWLQLLAIVMGGLAFLCFFVGRFESHPSLVVPVAGSGGESFHHHVTARPTCCPRDISDR